jgi:hypothetical protein
MQFDIMDLNDEGFISRIISEMEYSEEIQRRERSYDAFQVYSGNVAPYVRTELKRTRPKSWSSYTISDVSLSALVVNKLAKSYNQSPHRSLDSDEQTEKLQDLYRDIKADRQFKEFDCTFNRERQGLFWVTYRQDESRFQFMSLAPYEYAVIRNKDTADLELVILSYPDTTITQNAGTQSDGTPSFISENQADGAGIIKTYALWTATQHAVVQIKKEPVVEGNKTVIKRSVTYVDMPDNPNRVNALGMLPFVYMSKDNSPDYPTESPLLQQTITANALMSELLTSANIQGAGQLIFEYPQSMQGQFDNLTTGLTEAIELPQSEEPNAPRTTATYINPSPDLAGQLQSYESYIKFALAQHGITTSQGVSGGMESFSSGLERMVAQADVQSIISENQQMFYVDLEKKVFSIVKRWSEVAGLGLFQANEEITVKYEKPKVMVTDTEKINNIKQLLDLGLMTKAQALMKLDPNLDEDKAEQILLKITEEKQANLNTFMGGINGGQSNEDDSIEPRGDSEGEENPGPNRGGRAFN